MNNISEKLNKKLSELRLLVTDVDGVMTDGSFYIGEHTEFKRFHSSDGLAFLLLRLADFPVAVISGRYSTATLARTRALKIPDELVFQDSYIKTDAFEILKKRFELQDHEIAYVGDDLIDTPVMERCGVAFAPSNAVPRVREIADYVTETPGGSGALREVTDIILNAQNRMETALRKLYGLY